METIFKPTPQKGFSRNNDDEAVYQLLSDSYQDFLKITLEPPRQVSYLLSGRILYVQRIFLR
jgi:hypothetical protein